MSYFIFAGDMFVMLFMFCVAIWVFVYSPDDVVDHAANIPLNDEEHHG